MPTLGRREFLLAAESQLALTQWRKKNIYPETWLGIKGNVMKGDFKKIILRNFQQNILTDEEKKSHPIFYEDWMQISKYTKRKNDNVHDYINSIYTMLPHDFCACSYIDLHQDLSNAFSSPEEGVKHFIKYGNSGNRDYLAFDSDFYMEFYPELELFDKDQAYRYWKEKGISQKHFPNINSYICHLRNKGKLPKNFSLIAYKMLNQDIYLEQESDIQITNHFLKSGLNEKRPCNGVTIDPIFVYELYGIKLKKSVRLSNFQLPVLVGELNNSILYSKKHLLAFCNVANKFLDFFDAGFYYRRNAAVQKDIQEPNYTKCLRHFLTKGKNDNLSFSEKYFFDSDFYSKKYGIDLDGVELINYWLKNGLLKGDSPNRNVYSKNILGLSVEHAENLLENITEEVMPFETFFYRREKDIVQALDKILSYNFSYEFNEVGLSMFCQLIHNNAGKNDKLAIKIFDYLMSSVDDIESLKKCISGSFYGDIADCYLREKLYCSAIDLYEKSTKENMLNPWPVLNLSLCWGELGNYRKAFLVLKKYYAKHRSCTYKKTYANICQRFFAHEFSTAKKLAKNNHISESITKLENCCQTIAINDAGIRHANTIKSIAIVGNEDLQQCAFYRIKQKIKQLECAGFKVKKFKFPDEVSLFVDNIFDFQSVIFYRIPAFPSAIDAIETANRSGLITFFDIDDLVFDKENYPPPFHEYLNAIDYDQYVGLILGAPLLQFAMSLCHYGISSTTTLAKYMEKVVKKKKAFVHPNGIDACHTSQLSDETFPPKNDGVVKIIYGSNTLAHKDDFVNILLEPLLTIADTYLDSIEIYLVGTFVFDDDLLTSRKNIFLIDGGLDLNTYWDLLRKMDINLAVLRSYPATDCKSEIKWLEAALFKIPSIVSNTATYSEVIENGKTGFLCDSSEEWLAALDLLITDSSRRKEVGEAAYDIVTSKYSLKTLSENLVRIFDSVLNPSQPKRKIVFVNVYYAPETIGGATRVMIDNIEFLQKNHLKDFELEVFSTNSFGKNPYEVSCYVHNGIKVTSICSPTNGVMDVYDPKILPIFEKFLENSKPDLIHFHCIQHITTAALRAAINKSIPYVITLHDGWWISDNQFIIDSFGNDSLYDFNNDLSINNGNNLNERQSILYRYLKNSSANIAVSNSFANLCSTCGVPRVLSFPNGINLKYTGSRTASLNDKVRVAFIGGMALHKGYDIIKRVFEETKFNNIELSVVNDGSSNIFFEKWNKNYVFFKKRVPLEEVSTLYNNIDVILAPSVWPESFGLVTREALLHGCWVIASNKGGIGDDIIEGVNGFKIDVSNSTGLRDILIFIDNNYKNYLCSPCASTILQDTSLQCKKIVDLYGKVLGQS